MKHRLSPQAEAELDDLWYFIATESGSPDIADRFLDSLTQHFYLLVQYPRLGRPRDAELRPGIRSFPVKDFLILYSLTPQDDVLILHIVRGSRDLDALLHP